MWFYTIQQSRYSYNATNDPLKQKSLQKTQKKVTITGNSLLLHAPLVQLKVCQKKKTCVRPDPPQLCDPVVEEEESQADGNEWELCFTDKTRGGRVCVCVSHVSHERGWKGQRCFTCHSVKTWLRFQISPKKKKNKKSRWDQVREKQHAQLSERQQRYWTLRGDSAMQKSFLSWFFVRIDPCESGPSDSARVHSEIHRFLWEAIHVISYRSGWVSGSLAWCLCVCAEVSIKFPQTHRV